LAMATLRQIRRRIRSIQSTAKVTRAMELVAASKMRRGPGGGPAAPPRPPAALARGERAEGREVQVVAVGRKGRDFFARAGYPLAAEFTRLGDYPSYEDTRPIASLLVQDYATQETDR